MYHTGECINVGLFSHKMVGNMIDDYRANAKALSDQHWAKIMDIIGLAQIAVENHCPSPNAAPMQQKHRILYVTSSD